VNEWVQVATLFWPELLRACESQPMEAPLSVKATLPVGLPLPPDETVAVKVTELLGLVVNDGFRLDETVVVVPTAAFVVKTMSQLAKLTGSPWKSSR